VLLYEFYFFVIVWWQTCSTSCDETWRAPYRNYNFEATCVIYFSAVRQGHEKFTNE